MRPMRPLQAHVKQRHHVTDSLALKLPISDQSSGIEANKIRAAILNLEDLNTHEFKR